ncbi:MAG: DUF6868 family protein [Verrucomicrobiota bacterium]
MMNISKLTEFFGWCSLINLAILFFATFGLMTLRSWISKIHGKVFHLSEKELAQLYFSYLGHYKIIIMVFNITPYIALRIISHL